MRRVHWSTVTPSEVATLDAAADGLTIPETAKRFFVTPQTVKFHRTNLFWKLGANNIAHAVAIGLRQGVISMNGEKFDNRKAALSKLHATEYAAVKYARIIEGGGPVDGEEYDEFRHACDEFHEALKKVFEE